MQMRRPSSIDIKISDASDASAFWDRHPFLQAFQRIQAEMPVKRKKLTGSCLVFQNNGWAIILGGIIIFETVNHSIQWCKHRQSGMGVQVQTQMNGSPLGTFI